MIALTGQIIDSIRINRISTTEIADVLGKTGALDIQIKPLNCGKHIVGKTYYVPAFNGSNWYAHYYMQRVPKGSVVYVEAINCGDKAVFGELVTKFAVLYREACGIIVDGYLRDIPRLIKNDYPVWCRGGTPIGCDNQDKGFDRRFYLSRKKQLEGSLLVADDSGCVLVKKDLLNNQFLGKLDAIEEQEDIWFDAIDRLKLSTYETVCQKKYLTMNRTKRNAKNA